MDAEYYEKEAKAAVDKLVGIIHGLEADKERLSFSFAGSKIEALEDYKMPHVYLDTKDPASAQRRADELYEADKATRERNLPKIENNKRLKAALIELMKNLGFSATTYTVEGRRGKRVEHTSDWAMHLGKIRVTEPWDIDRLYKEWCDRIAAAKKADEERLRERKRQEEADEKNRAKIRFVVEVGVKYGQDFKEVSDVIDFLLGKDKYLHLAYWLERNRGDWLDGSDYAEIGLNGFTIEAPIDQEIYDEISDLLEDFEDGRVFRDCVHNYDYLYGMAEQSLVADLGKAREYSDH